MGKTIGLFSGQGSQTEGMGKELYDNFSAAKRVYDIGEKVLSVPLKALSFQGSQEEISTTNLSQPLIFACSVAAYESGLEFAPKPDAVCGHSLGEFAALYAAGAFSLEDGFRIIEARGKAMNNAAQKAKGGMTAIIGLDKETIMAACRAVGGFVFPVNLNLPNQTVISGLEEDVDKVTALLTAESKRVKAVKLQVSSAFHTSMMGEAAEEFRSAIEGISFSKLKIPLFSNVTAGLFQPDNYPDYFAQHMVSPVRFVEEVAAMTDFGADRGVEYGSGKTVSTLVKKNNKAFSVLAVGDCEGIEALKSFY